MGKVDFNIGEFRTKVAVLSLFWGRSASGAVLKLYEETSSVFAKVEEVVTEGGIEGIVAIKLLEVITYRHADIKNSARLQIGEEVYEILAINPVKDTWVKITARQI